MMAKTKTMTKSPTTRVTSKVTAALPTNGEATRGEQPECRSQDQMMDSCEEAIREMAYLKWQDAGCPSGDGFDFWLEAEQALIAGRSCSPDMDA